MNENSHFGNSIPVYLKSFPLCLARSIRSRQYFRKVAVEPFLNKYQHSIEPFFRSLENEGGLILSKEFPFKSQR
ncbi:hypothetical protein LEP1GSC036_4385 [Leptospira weilii str. 2006001853]|uniref:Uncharacterized protein n=1 Tax=Leptospira weilii str. 2006001853 TaxID=1001589 RepID=A0A828Z0E4_9LEPT|nr:hypothetical protein LEP1GSC036_4385 [Leptospira weilii str. 2006001853]EMN46486.1 hypothetical protein LEP1GSC086_3130 [Leptospira weilii str. LNT 1234]